MTIQMREFGKSVQIHRASYVPIEKIMVTEEGGQKITVNKKGTGRMRTKMLGSFKTKLLAYKDLDTRNLNIILEDHGIELDFEEKLSLWELVKVKWHKEHLERLATIPESLPKDLNELAGDLSMANLTQEQFDAILNAVDGLTDAVRKYESIFDETKNLVIKPTKERLGK